MVEQVRFAKFLEMADEIEQFRFCSVDCCDGDVIAAYVYSYKHLAKRFVNFVGRIRNCTF
jgi:hypothetical protein